MLKELHMQAILIQITPMTYICFNLGNDMQLRTSRDDNKDTQGSYPYFANNNSIRYDVNPLPMQIKLNPNASRKKLYNFYF